MKLYCCPWWVIALAYVGGACLTASILFIAILFGCGYLYSKKKVNF